MDIVIYIKTRKKVYDPTSGMRALGRRVIDEFSESMNREWMSGNHLISYTLQVNSEQN